MRLLRLLTSQPEESPPSVEVEERGWRSKAIEEPPPHLTVEEWKQAEDKLQRVRERFPHLLDLGG